MTAPRAMPPAISVIIPHLNQPDHLRKCLESLQDQDFGPAAAEIIVVDNGSRALPCAVTGRHANVTLAEEAEPGPGPARNRGAALAGAPILAFTDADCVADRGWLAAIHARFAADPGLEILGGDVRIVIETPGRPTRAEAFEMLYAFRQQMQIERDKFSATANVAMRRAVFDAVGPFAGIEISEDVDWGQRAAAAGHRTQFAEEVIVYHPARRSMAALRAQWNRHISHFYRTRAVGVSGHLSWTLTAALMALSPIAEIPTVMRSPKLATPRERGLAFLGLVEIRLYRAYRMITVMFDPAARTANTRWNRS